MHPARVLALATVVGILLAACSGPAASPTSPGAAPTSPAATGPAATAVATSPAATAGGNAVTIVDFGFEPQDISVKVGTTVTWTNTGSAPHTVKWSDGTPESQQLGNGGTYTRTFDKAGSIAYVCGIHGRMTGTVTVTE